MPSPPDARLRTTREGLSLGGELRLQALGAQTVLPPSRHPSGRLYAWRPGRGPKDIVLATAPVWLLAALRDPNRRANSGRPRRAGAGNAADVKRARAALAGLAASRAADYDSWLRVGMALHSVDEGDELLAAWDEWSKLCPETYEPDVCESKWNTFNAERGITHGSLIHWAREDGWTPPTLPGPTPSPVAQQTVLSASGVPDLAREPDPMKAIRDDLAAIGIVGESDNALLVYVIYTSRVLADPAAVVARGTKGTGKSTVMTKTATLFPPEVKVEAMQMTNAAWFNTPDDFFKHKVFVSGERKHSTTEEAKDAGACLRQLLSEKKINRGLSVYDEGAKRWSTVWVERPGPVAYAESTTAKSIFEEDLDRMLQVYTDNSEEHKRNVLDAIGSKYDPDAQRPDTDAIVGRHHAFQRWLQTFAPCRVGIPYHRAVTLLLSVDAPSVFRATQLLLTIIQTIALLHRQQREERNGYVIATLDDYSIARQLLLEPLGRALGIGEWHKGAEMLRKVTKPDEEFTTPQVKVALGFTHDMGPSRLLKGLLDAGVIVRTREQSGRTPRRLQVGGGRSRAAAGVADRRGSRGRLGRVKK